MLIFSKNISPSLKYLSDFGYSDLQKVCSYNQELLSNVCNKRREIKALRLKNAELEVAKDEAEGKYFEIQTLSFAFSMSNFSELLFFLSYSVGETIHRYDWRGREP